MQSSPKFDPSTATMSVLCGMTRYFLLKSESTPSPLLYSCINRNTYYHNRYSGATAVRSQFILQYPKWLCNYFTLWSLGLRITICMCYNNYFSWIPNSTIDKNSSFIIDKMICIFEVCANQVHLLSIQSAFSIQDHLCLQQCKNNKHPNLIQHLTGDCMIMTFTDTRSYIL